LRQELEKLLRTPYWVTQNTRTNVEVVYRSSMFGALMAETTSGWLDLTTDGNTTASGFDYYIPAASYIMANEQNKGFRLVRDGIEVIFSPYALHTNNNVIMPDVAEELKRKNIDDYFVRLSINFTAHSSVLIDGDEALTDMVAASVTIVGMSQTEKAWDTANYNLLVDEVKRVLESQLTKDQIAAYIRRAINGDVIDEDFSKMILGIAQEVRERFHTVTISNRLQSVIRNRKTFNIDRFDAPVIIAANLDESESMTIRGYQRIAREWVAREVVDFSGGKAIYATSPGEFIFVGRIIRIPGLDGEENAGQTIGIVAKYGLDEFFGSGASININADATRYMLIGSISRIAGSARGSDPYAYLQSRGHNISNRNEHNPITTEESLYLVMVLYELKTNTAVDTITIRNYSATANINGITERYKKSVQAAFELGLYSNRNMNPRGFITIGEVLDMLTKLDSKARL